MDAWVQEQDMDPLVRSSATTNNGDSTTDQSSSVVVVRRYKQWVAALFCLSIGALAIYYMQGAALVLAPIDIISKPLRNKRDVCPRLCQARHQQHLEKWNGDLLDTSDMLQRAFGAREATITQLKEQYGDKYFDKLFFNENGTSIGRTAFVSANEDELGHVSIKRFRRKLMLKILSVQLAVQQEARNAHGCDCSFSNTKRNLQGNSAAAASANASRFQLPDHYARFVWVNGGHSAAAGHGNLFNETYTAVMERTARHVFASIGIELEGRNYAMGGMSSAPELALCQEAVYGTDADVLTWNFGMTDGDWFWRNRLYGYRRGAHVNRPLLLDIDVGTQGWAYKGRVDVLRDLEQAGLPVMYSKLDLWFFKQIAQYVPDTQNKTQQQIDAIPEFLRHFKCGDKIEVGEPTCDEHKYTDTVCKDRSHKAGWHPGWRAHALSGNIMAFFMIESLIDALKELEGLLQPSSGELLDRNAVRDELKRQEDEDYEAFFNSSVPQLLEGFWEEDVAKEVQLSSLFRSRAMCHTALLPAQTRYLGILTEIDDSSFENYDFGTRRADADRRNATHGRGEMPLTYDGIKGEGCPVLTFIDYKDYFFVKEKDGDMSLTLPNKAEQETFVGDEKLQGLVVVCLIQCDWGRCPRGDMREEDIRSGNVTMTVNDNRVTGVTWFSPCGLLRGDNGYFWKANSAGQYELTARVNYPQGYLRLSSVILL